MSILDRLLRATTKKVVNFFEEKCTPLPDKILATPMFLVLQNGGQRQPSPMNQAIKSIFKSFK